MLSHGHILTMLTGFSLGCLLVTSGCGNSSASSDEETGTTTETVVATTSSKGGQAVPADNQGVTVENPIALVYPLGFGLSFFPGKDSRNAYEEYQDSFDRLKGSAASCLGNLAKPVLVASSCYGENSGMIYKSLPQISGSIDGTDGNGEACHAVAIRQQTQDIAHSLRTSLLILQGLICQARKSSILTPPKLYETLTLKLEAETLLAGIAASVTAANLTRLDDYFGRPRFRIDLVYNDAMGATQEMHLLHVPQGNLDNNTYTGTLWLKHLANSAVAETVPTDLYVSIQYAKILKEDGPRVLGRLTAAKFVRPLGDLAISSEGLIDVNISNDTKGNYINPKTGKAYPIQENAAAEIRLVEFNRSMQDDTGDLAFFFDRKAQFHRSAQGFRLRGAVTPNQELKFCSFEGVSAAKADDDLSLRKAAVDGKPIQLRGFDHPDTQIEDAGPCFFSDPQLQEDSQGRFYNKTCSGSEIWQWYVPALKDTALSKTFATKLRGSLLTKQCFVRSRVGLYVLDPEEITEKSGYLLIDAETSSDLTPPNLGGLERIPRQ